MSDPPPRQNDITISQTVQVLRQLAEGDRVRVLQFAEAVKADRTAKRSRRQRRYERKPIDCWRIGE